MKAILRKFFSCFLLLMLLAADCNAEDQARQLNYKWRTLQKDGVHWLVTPEGKLFYSKGVNFIDCGKDTPQSQRKEAFYWRNFFPTLDDWRRTAGLQLGGWGFNTRGGWCDPSPQIGLPLTVDLELGRNSKFHWFDPFDPGMEEKTREWAEKLTAPYRNDPHILGYFSDNEVGWWNSALFIWYLSKGWENHTKRLLWQLLYDRYDGSWEKLLVDWVPQGNLSSFEALKGADVQLKLRPGGNGIKLVDRFMYLCAHRYYELMYRSIRAAHPEALILGDRLPLYYHQDALMAIGEYVDVISTNYNVDAADGWVAPYYFEGLQRLSSKPVLVTEFFFAAEENRTGNRNETARSKHPKPGHLMTVQTQKQRAEGLANAIRNFAQFPNIVGAHWFQYCDEPRGGREDGEDYNMGLIDTSNRPYEEVTETFKTLNPQLDGIHLKSATKREGSNGIARVAGSEGTPDGTVSIPRITGTIDVTDQSLTDWDKAGTRIPDLKAPEPYVPFGDVHLGWAPEGLYIASIANTYVNPDFLAYEGEFPYSEAFQLHLLVEAEGKASHHVIYLLPRDNPNLPDGFEIIPKICRYGEGESLECMPTEGRVQRIEKSLPHMLLEGFFPAEWLGMERLEPGMRLRMNIVWSSYFRDFTAVWSGEPSLQSLDDPQVLRTVVLHDPIGEKGFKVSRIKESESKIQSD